jgi:hypothetical protein
MAGRARSIVEAGTPAGSVALVVGAAHAAAIVAGDVDDTLVAMIPPPVAAELTLVPYSFPRLAGQMGYGAGNRAPLYYQRAHDAGADYRRATLEVLVAFTDHLRLRGYAASLADTIEAFRLAVMLAAIRGKAEPARRGARGGNRDPDPRRPHAGGRVPVVDGRRARGRARRVPDRPQLAPGRVLARGADRPAAHRRAGAGHPAPQQPGRGRHLRLPPPPPRGRIATRATPAPGRAAPRPRRRAGSALARPRETWEVQWTPATEATLVEAIVRGPRWRTSPRRRSTASWPKPHRAVPRPRWRSKPWSPRARTAGQALDATERLAAEDADLPSLARRLAR